MHTLPVSNRVDFLRNYLEIFKRFDLFDILNFMYFDQGMKERESTQSNEGNNPTCDQILKKITRASKNMSMKLCKCTIDFHNSFSVLVYCCETVCRTCRLWSTAATTEQCKHVAVSICWYYHLVAMHEYRIHFIYSRILFYVHTVFLVYFIEANLLI